MRRCERSWRHRRPRRRGRKGEGGDEHAPSRRGRAGTREAACASRIGDRSRSGASSKPRGPSAGIGPGGAAGAVARWEAAECSTTRGRSAARPSLFSSIATIWVSFRPPRAAKQRLACSRPGAGHVLSTRGLSGAREGCPRSGRRRAALARARRAGKKTKTSARRAGRRRCERCTPDWSPCRKEVFAAATIWVLDRGLGYRAAVSAGLETLRELGPGHSTCDPEEATAAPAAAA